MAEKKKQKPAAFAQEKKTFTGEIPKKANEGKGKKSAAYQPRDADTTSGHDVQRSKNTKKYQKADASGQNVQKSEGAEAGEKSKSDFMQPDNSFGREMDFGFIVDIGGSCMECIRRYTRPTLMKMP